MLGLADDLLGDVVGSLFSTTSRRISFNEDAVGVRGVDGGLVRVLAGPGARLVARLGPVLTGDEP